MSFRRKSKAGGKKTTARGNNKRAVYNIPDQLDIDLKAAKVALLSKSLDDNGRPKPLTLNQLKGLIRSAIRKKWMHCPQKLAFLESRMVPDTDPESRRLWKIQCEMCKEWFRQNEVDVDHKIGEHSFTELADLEKWASSILDVGGDEDLAILCSDTCHPLKTIMESHGLTLEEAKLFKKATAWEGNKDINHKEWLISKGYDDKMVSNKTKRRECYIAWLESEGGV